MDPQIDILKFLKREFKADLQKIRVLTQYNAQRHLLEEKIKAAIVEYRDMFEHYDKMKINVSTVVSSQGMEDIDLFYCLQSVLLTKAPPPKKKKKKKNLPHPLQIASTKVHYEVSKYSFRHDTELFSSGVGVSLCL